VNGFGSVVYRLACLLVASAVGFLDPLHRERQKVDSIQAQSARERRVARALVDSGRSRASKALDRGFRISGRVAGDGAGADLPQNARAEGSF